MAFQWHSMALSGTLWHSSVTICTPVAFQWHYSCTLVAPQWHSSDTLVVPQCHSSGTPAVTYSASQWYSMTLQWHSDTAVAFHCTPVALQWHHTVALYSGTLQCSIDTLASMESNTYKRKSVINKSNLHHCFANLWLIKILFPYFSVWKIIIINNLFICCISPTKSPIIITNDRRIQYKMHYCKKTCLKIAF